MAAIVGMDVGTSTSVVAVMERGKARTLSQDDRDRMMPTVVSFGSKGEISVGASAAARREINPEFTFTGLKRLLGRKATDPAVQEWAGQVAYVIEPGPKGEAFVRGPDRLYSPQELIAHVMRRLKEVAQASLSQEVTRCVIGVPAYFDVHQKDAVRQAARLAGLEPVRLLSEPTAAAVAYAIERGANRTIAVYDFGGGTFDVSILKISGQRFHPLATAGDSLLGGEDFDQRIVDWAAQKFRDKHGVDLRDSPLPRARLVMTAELAKIELSTVNATRLFQHSIAHNQQQFFGLNLDEELTREEFEDMVADLIDRTRAPCREALRRAKVDPRDIADVVLVGGMTRMPKVQEVVADIFGRTPRRDIDPLAAVALGCAMQGAALAGEIKSVSVPERLTQSFGVEVGNGAGVKLLRAGRLMPARETQRFGLADKSADAAAIRVYQGDLGQAADNRQVCRLVLNSLNPDPTIDVTIDIDEDGMLMVAAEEVGKPDTRVEYRMHSETGLEGAAADGLRNVDDFEEAAPDAAEAA